MAYLLRRTDQGGGFLAAPGSGASYTHDLRRARLFQTKEQAEAERCPDNEVPVPLDWILPAAFD